MSLNHSRMEAAESLIRTKARRLCRRPGFTTSDEGDIEQELWTHLVEQEPKFDATRDWRKFVSFIADKRCSSIRRDRFAEKRDPRREEFSLDEWVRDSDGEFVARHELVKEASSDPQCLHDLRRDLVALRDYLPSDQHRRYLDAKARGGTTNSIAIEIGLPRPRVAKIEIEVREEAIRIGLGEYLN